MKMTLLRDIRKRLAILLLLPGVGFGQGWQWASRIEFYLVRDSNIFESLSHPKTDFTGRLLLDFSGKKQFIQNGLFDARYSGGVEGYSHHTIENRTINNLRVNLNIPIASNLSLGTALKGRFKAFFRTNQGYNHWQGIPFLRWSMTYGLQGELYYTYTHFDYAENNYFDHSIQGFGFLFETILSPKVRWKVGYISGTLKFQKEAFTYVKDTNETGLWMPLGRHQKDKLQEISSSLEIYKWALLRLGVSYQWNRSNSYGYSYNRPQLRLIAAKQILWSLTLRIYWVQQWKHYNDLLDPLLQIHPETEEETNSYALIDLTKDIGHHRSLSLRIGWYKNESPFRDFYYEKTRLSLGLTQRL